MLELGQAHYRRNELPQVRDQESKYTVLEVFFFTI